DGAVDEYPEVDLVDGRGDADFRQEELDQFADRDGRLGAGRPDLDLEAVGVTSLGQQRLGAFRIVGDPLDGVVVTGKAGRDGGVGQLVRAVVRTVDDRLTVDGHGDGAAHAHVLELLDALVERPVEDGQLVDGLDLVGALRVVDNVEGQRSPDAGGVEVTCQGLAPPDQILGDDAPVDPRDLRRAVVVVGVGFQRQARVAQPARELEWTRADGVVGQVFTLRQSGRYGLGHD